RGMPLGDLSEAGEGDKSRFDCLRVESPRASKVGGETRVLALFVDQAVAPRPNRLGHHQANAVRTDVDRSQTQIARGGIVRASHSLLLGWGVSSIPSIQAYLGAVALATDLCA